MGSKRVGLALTDPLGLTIQPLRYLKNRGLTDLLTRLKLIIVEKGVEKAVVGLPISLDGTLGVKARACQNMAKKIEDFCHVPVELEDESFTSREAEEILTVELGLSRKKRKEARDSMAACLILKSYLSHL